MKALLLGVLLSALIGFSAYKKKALSLSGFTAAVVLGTVIYLCGGFRFKTPISEAQVSALEEAKEAA